VKARLFVLFVVGFVLNFLWEKAHSVLYVSHNGMEMTHRHLAGAALFDAVVITALAYLCFYSPLLKGALPSPALDEAASAGRSAGGISLFVFALFIFAILLEKYALATGRWVYADAMPIIPLLNVGLTPMIQLGLLGYLSLSFTGWIEKGSSL